MKKQSRGFTIIEVVLVLAIAGLIFLMVFIALPALQRGQRNTQRKNDLSRFVTAVTQYQSNNSGSLPNDLGSLNGIFVERYIKAGGDEQFQDPDGESYYFANNNAAVGCASGCSSSLNGTKFQVDTLTYRTPDGVKTWTGHRIYLTENAKCGAEEGTLVGGMGKRFFALQMVLEGNSIACADNQ
ncbi:type II secretion system protein [Candidatus Saccharibacteria bacterium]|nr:type II secretion system protein [Candidatus Saccharibacteria bacterium]